MMPGKGEPPKVGVLYDAGSAGPVEIFAACRGLCEPVFIRNGAEGARLGRSALDITGLGPDAAAAAVRAAGIGHLITFSERQLMATAEIAERTGIGFLSSDTALLCQDKAAQRRALADRGVDMTRTRALRDPGDLADALTEIGLPAVIKPRQGMSSAYTVRVDTLSEAREWLKGWVARSPGTVRELVVEEMLQGDSGQAGPEWGDYVSVESIVDGAEVHHVCVTGKFPLAEPFRETGLVYPSTIDAALHARVCDLAGAAVRALGIDRGATHTEVKLTAEGPRIIEVNGRLGGYIADSLRHAAGFDLIAAAIRSALGLPLDRSVPEPRQVGYKYQFQPPRTASRVTEMRGAETLEQIPGVRRFELSSPPGSPVDWSRGSGGHVGIIHGEAADHDGVLAAIQAATTALEITYE
ncbi:ATP-grasp domain-containing protein [Actinomadura monticuli]|uniref:ATP-grasp domain-containing protein n=1 Tax=Actinomadura monticuli TaxID=3097367 RepID=A0ABV4Q6Q9_9ACTN